MTEPVHITVVPHTHWDREWYEPFEGFLARLVPMIDHLLDLVDDGFPHFHLDGQTALLDDYLDVRPEREADLRAAIADGRLGIGPWFTQMDEFLTSGESQIRNLERGMARTRDLGAEPTYAYLPDQFGHIGQMPQILRAAGIDRVVLWRGVPAAVDRTNFHWDAPDGSRVLVEYLPLGYGIGKHLRERDDPAEVAAELDRLVDRLAPLSPRPDRFLVMAGNDHHGPDPTLHDRLAAARSGRAVAEVGSIAGHVAGDAPADLPVWRGELRSAARAHLLPNVYGTRVTQKHERARAEVLVERYAEPLAALVAGLEWPDEVFDRMWQLLLWNGAHDSVCGCSVDEVAADVDDRAGDVVFYADAIVTQALELLATRVDGEGTVRFNPSPFEREGVPGLGWSTEPAPPDDGPELKVQLDGDGVLIDGLRVWVSDEPDIGDLYNFCPAPDHAVTRPDTVAVIGTVATFEWDGLAVRLQASRGDRHTRLEVRIDNDRDDHRVRLHVGLPATTDHSHALSPFEIVQRPLESEGSDLEDASPNWPARGAALAGGVAVLADGVFEYEVVDGRALAVTLLRCVGTISRPDGLPVRPVRAGPDVATPGAQMLGVTAYDLGLVSEAAPQDLPRAWERFALPLRGTPAAPGGPLPPTGSLLTVDGAELSGVRRVGPDIEVRVWNPGADAVDVTVGARVLTLRPAGIETVSLDGPGAA